MPDPQPRPTTLSLDVTLHTPESVSLVFGVDSVMIYSPLRFWKFVENVQWQRVMLDVCNAFARLLGATAGIITPDSSPVLKAFFEEVPFDEALATGAGLESEVSGISDLYRPEVAERGESYGYHGYWRFL